MSIKLAADELSRMLKLYRSFEEAQSILDVLSSSEQKVKELSSATTSLEKEVEKLKAEKEAILSSISHAEQEAALEAAQELEKVEGVKAEAITLANSIVASAKEDGVKLLSSYKEKAKKEEEKLTSLQKAVASASQELVEKEDALAQVQNSINKLLGK